MFNDCNEMKYRTTKELMFLFLTTKQIQDSDCGSVGRAVASEPEVRGSNPVNGRILYRTWFTVNC